jgi:TatD family-associated radical SAM protein
VQWKDWCTWLDMQESSEKQKLPPSLETVSEIVMTPSDSDSNNLSRRPTVAELLEEIQAVSERSSFDAIVIAGEGEPTLRWKELLQLTEQLKEQQERNNDVPDTIVRVTTNGLAVADNGPEKLRAAGVSAVSVALMTHDPVLYDELMQPSSSSSEMRQAHARVCHFVQQAVQVGLQVEVTGVDRGEVNKAETEALAQSLGVTEAFRWRSYHP